MFRVKAPFYNMEGDIGSASTNEAASVVAEGLETLGDGNAPTPATEGTGANATSDDVTKQESFAKRLQEMTDKRLQEERQKWEQEQAEKYKDYDIAKKAASFLQKQAGASDLMSLAEQIELAELQERADEQNVPPEVLKRIDELEAKAAKAEEYERQQTEAQQQQSFEQSLIEFTKDKEGLDHKELWNYMYENGISKPEVAYKAMRAEQLEQQLANAKKTAVEEYLASKQAPKALGGGATAFQTVDTSKMSWEEIDRVAAARIRAANQPQ